MYAPKASTQVKEEELKIFKNVSIHLKKCYLFWDFALDNELKLIWKISIKLRKRSAQIWHYQFLASLENAYHVVKTIGDIGKTLKCKLKKTNRCRMLKSSNQKWWLKHIYRLLKIYRSITKG